LDREAKKVWDLMQDHQPVCIHGDFDSDGLCATIVLRSCLEALGIDCFSYLPSRGDGHGVSCDSLREVAQQGAKMVITVDCGVSAFAEARLAKELGVQFVVTDHHLPDENLPDAAAIINPQLDDDSSHQNLCGAGVALKLALAWGNFADPLKTRSERYLTFFKHAIVLTAIATVADMMPLTGNNRAIVGKALELQPAVTLPGLRCLMDHLKLNENSRSEDWSFQLIPRLNSAQRMERSDLLKDLFTCNETEALNVVRQLDDLNKERRALQAQHSKTAMELAPQICEDAFVWIQGDSWSEGFSGLMANQLVKHFGKPCAVMVESGDELHASLRCPPGYHLKHALDAASELILQYGGHAQAAGFQAKAEKAEALKTKLNEVFKAQDLGKDHLKLMIMDHIPFQELKPTLLAEQRQLEPFGQGNPKPVFATKGVMLDGSPRVIGADRSHVSFRVFIPGHESIDCIGFGFADTVMALDHHGRVDMAYQLGKSPYNSNMQLSIQSIRQHQTQVVHKV
jgi:single-stranded-DNA-specific exonuclease